MVKIDNYESMGNEIDKAVGYIDEHIGDWKGKYIYNITYRNRLGESKNDQTDGQVDRLPIDRQIRWQENNYPSKNQEERTYGWACSHQQITAARWLNVTGKQIVK